MVPLFYPSFLLVKNSSLSNTSINLHGLGIFSFIALTMACTYRLSLFTLYLSLAPKYVVCEERDFGLGNVASSVPQREYDAQKVLIE